ncbi:MAG: DUF2182 domain-containing protein [Gammaproteobacteria bacterium]|nr:DUF2182 domain-containing protein [Gammaproteobacteria bacterium]
MTGTTLKRLDWQDWGFAGLVLTLALAAWWWQVEAANDMAAMGEMAMPPTDWTGPEALAAALMWLIMMQAMMLPAALPVFLLYRRCLARDARRFAKLGWFVLGYTLVWSGFALLMTGLQALGESLGFLDWHLRLGAAWSGFTLLLAGLYQLSRLKTSCQRQCQSPLGYLSRHGHGGALRLGLGHGLYCLGCSWALMLLLLVAGAMNLWAMAALSLWVLLEKILPMSQGWRYGSAGLLVAVGLWSLIASTSV